MAAHAIRIGHALGVENVSDFVRLVTIDAGGKSVGLLFPKFSADSLAVDQFNIGMALGTGCGNVASVDG